jgi:Family of unknown function (DUF5994)
MTTSPDLRTLSPATRVPIRIQLGTVSSHGTVSGVWWPQSRDLQVEGADLVDHFPEESGHIARLLFSRPDWDNPVVEGRGVRRILARRGPVKVGSFPSDDTQLMILVLASGRRITLKVIASATDAVEADRQFRDAAEGAASGETIEGAHVRWDTEDPHT